MHYHTVLFVLRKNIILFLFSPNFMPRWEVDQFVSSGTIIHLNYTTEFWSLQEINMADYRVYFIDFFSLPLFSVALQFLNTKVAKKNFKDPQLLTLSDQKLGRLPRSLHTVSKAQFHLSVTRLLWQRIKVQQWFMLLKSFTLELA